MSHRGVRVWVYSLGVLMSGVVFAYVPSPQAAPTTNDVESLSPSFSARPLTATKRPSETLFAGRHSFRLPEPIDSLRSPPVRAALNPEPSLQGEKPFAPEPLFRSPRVRLPSMPSSSPAEEKLFPQSIPPSPRVSFPKSAVEYLLADPTLSGSQRTLIERILDRRRQLHEELSTQIRHDLERIERLAPNGRINEANAARIVKIFNVHLQKRQEIESHTLDALRDALTETQWNRLQKWLETRPGVSLDEAR